jgi:hypothetical protein
MSNSNTPVINQQNLNYSVLGREPDTTNTLLNTNFKFTLLRIPNVTFWCTSVNMPSVTIGSVEVANKFVKHHVPGSSIDLDTLKVTFIVDEEFTNWNEIYKWMRGLVPFEDFSEIIANDRNYYSDGTIHLLNSAKNPHRQITLKNMYPISLDGFELNSAYSDAEPITVNATFVYETFDIEHVT